MRLSIAAFAAFAASAHAFKDTSPFLMFSSRPFPTTLKDISKASLQSSSDVLKAAKSFLGACESEKYYIISQPQLSVSTLSNSLPHLQEALSHESVKSSLVVPETLGLKESHRQELVDFVKEKCGVKVNQKFVDDARYGARDVVAAVYEPMIGGWTDSEKKLGLSDPALQSNVLKDIRKHYTYTFILLTTPPTEVEKPAALPVYEAQFNDAVHMDLKRNLYARAENSSHTTDARPLFEKYQFLTPGLFMGLLVGLILLSILSVGLRAISSLQVSYGAFEKEMGPAAQKKQQ